MLTFIKEHPVVAAGGALAAGAAIAMIVHSRRAQANRLDRAQRPSNGAEHRPRSQKLADLADRASRLTSSLGDVLSRVDFHALSDRGQAYLESLRSRMMR